jgi:hypothetical protein
MHVHDDKPVIAEGGFDHLKSLQRLLQASRIESEIVAPPAKNCSS